MNPESFASDVAHALLRAVSRLFSTFTFVQ
jgi:hypothetical protein